MTKTIAGHSITLETGKRYFASRPMAKRGKIANQRFTISISPLSGVNSYFRQAIITIKDLTYDEANEFLAQFNNEECSLSGRVW